MGGEKSSKLAAVTCSTIKQYKIDLAIFNQFDSRNHSQSAVLITLENLLQGKTINPSLLCFEISEPDALISIDRTRAFLTRFKALVIDNFGVQTTIIHYLKELSVDYLKIDVSFTSYYANNSANAILCEMLIRVADLSGNTMIAKHIEQESVAKRLTEIGIELAQVSFFYELEPLSNLDNLNWEII
jgi:EAL domain-containing protein (putative c-di-GMP-specific phosphodiesterase class I)